MLALTASSYRRSFFYEQLDFLICRSLRNQPLNSLFTKELIILSIYKSISKSINPNQFNQLLSRTDDQPTRSRHSNNISNVLPTSRSISQSMYGLERRKDFKQSLNQKAHNRCVLVFQYQRLRTNAASPYTIKSIAVITVEPAGKASFVLGCIQTRLMGQYNGK